MTGRDAVPRSAGMVRLVRAGLSPLRPGPAALLVLGLCACEQRRENAPPAEMIVGEERALEDAASMLDESRIPANPLGEEQIEGSADPAAPASPPQQPAP